MLNELQGKNASQLIPNLTVKFSTDSKYLAIHSCKNYSRFILFKSFSCLPSSSLDLLRSLPFLHIGPLPTANKWPDP